MEGIITAVTGHPQFGPWIFFPNGNQVGDTIFFQVYDRGDGEKDHSDAFIEGALPALFGSPDINIIFAILAAPPPKGPGIGNGVLPDFVCRQVIKGNFEIGDED